MEHDKEYKENHENIDVNELDKQVEDAFVPKEGEEAMDEELKIMMQKRLRYKLWTKLFYSPEERKARDSK